MDILAHSLWTAALAKAANSKMEKTQTKKLSLLWSAFWGIFPDLFAFTIPFLVLLYNFISGTVTRAMFNPRSQAMLPESLSWIRDFTPHLYSVSHSMVIFLIVFLLVWVIRKKPSYEMLGWALHILIDIPTHGHGFYLTPFLWPISNWHFTHGIQWSTGWFMILNYSCLSLVYIWFWLGERLKTPFR